MSDAFVVKVNSAGSAGYGTYLGGAGTDVGYGIAMYYSGNAFVTGSTTGSFPTTSGAYQGIYGGGTNDAFVTEMNTTGSALTYSTYLGGSRDDIGLAIAVAPPDQNCAIRFQRQNVRAATGNGHYICNVSGHIRLRSHPLIGRSLEDLQ